MDKNSTLNNLLRYSYNETSWQETNAINNNIANNWEIKEQVKEIENMKNILKKMPLKSPSTTSIQIILNHSRQTEELQTFC